jgi:hypothetical protein
VVAAVAQSEAVLEQAVAVVAYRPEAVVVQPEAVLEQAAAVVAYRPEAVVAVVAHREALLGQVVVVE